MHTTYQHNPCVWSVMCHSRQVDLQNIGHAQTMIYMFKLCTCWKADVSVGTCEDREVGTVGLKITSYIGIRISNWTSLEKVRLYKSGNFEMDVEWQPCFQYTKG